MHDLRNAATVEVVNRTKSTSMGSRVTVARSFWDRGRGLMFRSGLADGSGLVIDPCASIHTMWMRFPIDVLYVAEDGAVLRADPEMKPWRVGPLFVKGRYVIELPPGTIQKTRTERGDLLELRPV